jgi:CubicO group peptidase (beta-lactamase class C family)
MTTTIDVQGLCDQCFSAVRVAFAENFARGWEIGAPVCITWNGETVVDLWAGNAAAACTTRWSRDHIANVYSTTKGLGATCAHIRVDRGQFDLDAPVTRYWPEFGQAGKENLPVRLPGMYDAVDVPYTPPSGTGQGTSVG